MTVIEPGERKAAANQHRCPACRCLFGYKRADFGPGWLWSTSPPGHHKGLVACPNCGENHMVKLVEHADG